MRLLKAKWIAVKHFSSSGEMYSEKEGERGGGRPVIRCCCVLQDFLFKGVR